MLISDSLLKHIKNDINVPPDVNIGSDKANMIKEVLSDMMESIITTVGIGLSKSDDELYLLAENGLFNQEYLKSVYFRFPIAPKNKKIFEILLFNDFETWLKEERKIGNFAYLKLEEHNITIYKNKLENKNEWKRAKQFQPT